MGSRFGRSTKRTGIGRPAVLVVAVLALGLLAEPAAGASTQASTPDPGPTATAAKKCKKLKSKKKRRKCRRSRSSGLSADAQMLLSRRLFFEHDFDNDAVCYLYHFTVDRPTGALIGGRTTYFRNPFTDQCRITEPQGPQTGSPFNWSAANGLLSVRFASGYTELIGLGQLQPNESVAINRPLTTGPSLWVTCRSAIFPPTLSFGCYTGT